MITLSFLLLTICICYLFQRRGDVLPWKRRVKTKTLPNPWESILYIQNIRICTKFDLYGLAGVLWAHSIGSVFPRNFSFEMSVLFLSMLVFGGLGTIRGAVFGAFVLYILPEFFRFIENYRMLVYGGMLAMIVILQPNGILGRGDCSIDAS